MPMSVTRRELAHEQSIFVNDYVVVDNGHYGSIEGVVVGLDHEVREALVHEFIDGRPTDRLHEVSVTNCTQHDEGRATQ